MSNKRSAEDEVNNRPTQRQRSDFSQIPMLLLQVWPELVVEAREARQEAEATIETLRRMLVEKMDDVWEAENRLSDEQVINRKNREFQQRLLRIIADLYREVDVDTVRRTQERVASAALILRNPALDQQVIDLVSDSE